jgi:hypothetical protein
MQQELEQRPQEQMLPLQEQMRERLVRVLEQQLVLEQQQEQLLLSYRKQPRQRQR